MTTMIRRLARYATCQLSGAAAAMLLLLAAALPPAPAGAQDVAFKNFSEVRVTGPVNRQSSADNYALIIYNSTYQDDAISDLAVTELDARAMEKLFQDMGYPAENIMVVGDGTKRDIEDQIFFFTEKLDADSSVVIYYSGHGITFEGDPSNYIVPVDMSAQSQGSSQATREAFFKRRAVNFNRDVLGVIKAAGPKGVVVFYDACRNSPLASSDPTKAVGQEQGFVPAKVEGTAIFYSARNGETSLAALSSDDDVKLSVYTRVLITQLSRNPSIRLSDLHRELQSSVARMARNKPGGSHSQNPVMENGLDYSRSERNEFCLALADVNGVQGCTGPDGVPEPIAPDDLSKVCTEAPIRGRVGLIPTIAQAREERDRYIQCDDLREEITARIADLSWEETKAENTCASYRAYLQFHPDSSHADTARQKEAEACRQMTQAEIRAHVVGCETTAARLGFASFGMQQPELEAAAQSCAIAATDPSVDSRQISFHHAVIMLALGQSERALDALKFAAGTVPEAALKLGDTLSSEEIPLPQRDLSEALFWYERAASSSSVSAEDQRRALFRVVELQNELGNPSAAMDAYALLIQRATQARPILAHLRQFPEGVAGRLSPSDAYELLFFRFPDGALAYQIGEAWESGVHGGANMEQARVWYTRAQERGYARAQSKLDGMAGGGAPDSAQLWDELIACLEQSERALNEESRLERGIDCTDGYLDRAARDNPDRPQVEEHREALVAELASYQQPKGNGLTRFLPPQPQPPADPW
ncbi:MAG: hypothetical protein GYB53_23485, partial [Rhodobacteraceae bacterium]|nr:hypothetical protein [Paracoccaceae bacterium]